MKADFSVDFDLFFFQYVTFLISKILCKIEDVYLKEITKSRHCESVILKTQSYAKKRFK